MYCKKCGTQLDDAASFCPNCGTAVSGHSRKTKKKKPLLLVRIILVLLTLIIVIPATLLCIAILSNSGTSTENGDSVVIQTESITLDEANADQSSFDGTIEAPESNVLVDNDTFTATYVGAQDQADLGVFYVTLKIENKSDVDALVSVEDADVDGETVQMVMTGIPLVVQPGNSGQTAFIFPMSNLSITSMNEAETATFRIVLRNNDTFEVLSESELVTVDLTK